MSIPQQFSMGVPQPPKETGPLQFKKTRKYFGEENKADMKKSSIFFSNPHSVGQQQLAPAPVNTQQGSIRLEFKKKNVVHGGSNKQIPEPKEEQKPLGFQPITAAGKPMMYSSLIIKPTGDYKSGGLEGLGKYVGDLNSRFGQDKPLQYEGFGKPASFFDTKKTTEATNSFTANSKYLGEEKKTNGFDTKYGEFGATSNAFTNTLKPSYTAPEPSTKLSYTPNFAPEYTPSLPTSYSAGYSATDNKQLSSITKHEFPMFAALTQKAEGLGISNASTASSSSSYPAPSYKDDKYYLDLGKNKVEQTYGASITSYSTPSYSSPATSFPTPSYTDYSSSSYSTPAPTNFSKKGPSYESKP
jgi:hypothetical protein